MAAQSSRTAFFLLALLAAGLAGPGGAGAQEELDAAGKKLLAAAGLFDRGLYKPSAQEYTEFLSQYPKHAQATTARYGLACCHYRLEEFADCAKLLGEVLKDKTFTKRDEALAVQGHCFIQLKQYDKSLAALDELLANHAASPLAATAAINRVQVLYFQGDKDGCLKAAGEFLAKYPNSGSTAAAQYYQALAMAGLDKPAQAADVLGKMLSAKANLPFEADALLLQGQCLEKQAKLPEAVEVYRKAARLSPARGQYSLGAALYRMGKYADSAAALRLAAGGGDNPLAGAARLQLAMALLADQKVADARSALKEIVEKDPARSASARYWLAQCDLADRKYAPALAALDECAKDKPANLAEITRDRAVCLMELGQYPQAADAFERYRQMVVDRKTGIPAASQGGGQAAFERLAAELAEAVYRQAFCLHKAGQYDASNALCEKVPANSALAQAASELTAENLFLLNKTDQAAAAIARLAESAKTPEQKLRYAFRLGQCHYLASRFDQAAAQLATVAASPQAANDPALRESIFLLGDCQLQLNHNPQAAEALARYCRLFKTPKDEAQYKLALAQSRTGAVDQAEKTLVKLTKSAADSVWVQRGLLDYAQILYNQKQARKAGPVLAELIASKPPEDLCARAVYLSAWIDFDARKFDSAGQQFARLVEQFPKHALADEADYQHALCLKEAGKIEQAVARLEAYVKDHPQGQYARDARALIGSSLAGLGKSDQAAARLAALAGDKASVSDQVLYQLAWAQRSVAAAAATAAAGRGGNSGIPARDGNSGIPARESSHPDQSAAIVTYRRLLAEYPQSKLASPARAELAELLAEGEQYAQAVELLEKCQAQADLDPRLAPGVLYRLGACYAKLDQHDQAAATFLAFAQKHAAHELEPSALYQGAIELGRANKIAQAEKPLADLLARFPRHELAAAAHLKLGEVQAERGEYDKSAQTCQAYLQKFPKDKFVYLGQFGAGWAAENLKQYDQARSWYAKVIAAHNGPTAARAQFQIGETYFAQQQYEKAVQELLKVDIVYAYPQWSSRALYEAGRAFEQLKQPDQARAQYKLCIEKYKDRSEAVLARKQLQSLDKESSK